MKVVRLVVLILILMGTKAYSQDKNFNRTFENPVIRGFNPDPAIVRVGEDYYIATSTFEWYPGIALYHSKDLVNWSPIGHALADIDLSGYLPSTGVFAPSLHYNNGKFYVVYSTVQSSESGWPQIPTPCYVVSTDDINGKWSKPQFLSSVGFDPSLYFEDDDVYLVNLILDFRKSERTMGKIGIQKFELNSWEPIGGLKIIADLDNAWGTEGPHIYKRQDYYYLMVAQGGTFYEHMITVLRSKTLDGAYEMDPDWPLLTSSNNEELVLQRAGHGCLVETQNGQWYISYLASRSLMPDRKSPLGRESCIQEVFWDDSGWLRMVTDEPSVKQPYPNLKPVKVKAREEVENFEDEKLSYDFQYLRAKPDVSWLVVSEGKLRVRGRRTLVSTRDVSLLAKRIKEYSVEAETLVKFEPESYRQKAGLSVFYDASYHYNIAVSHSDSLGKVVEITGVVNGKYEEFAIQSVASDWVKLKFSIKRDTIQFYFASESQSYKEIGSSFYFGNLSDEQESRSGFTGSMASLFVIDALNENKWAEFEYFKLSQ